MRHRPMMDARQISSSLRRLRSLWNCRSMSVPRQPAFWIVLIALAGFAARSAEVNPAASRQQPQVQAPPSDPRAKIRSTVELVVVPVTVKDSKGSLVDDVQKDEFRIFED